MRDVDVVVLSRFPEIFEGFKASIDWDAPGLRKMVGWDKATGLPPFPPPPWLWYWDSYAFQMARCANIGWKFARKDSDVLYCGDDTRIVEPGTITRLRELANSDPTIGILSPKIIGHAQELQMRPTHAPITYAPFVAFVFVYIKREVIDQVGYLDERYEGYGFEDLDYCYRVRKAGFKIGVAHDIAIAHGVGGHSYGSTFIQVRGEKQMGIDDAANRARFAEKWGIENDTTKIFEFIEAGGTSK